MEMTRDDVEFKTGDLTGELKPHERRSRESTRSRASDDPGRVTQARVVVSEWTKLISLRSTRWSLIVAVVLDDRPAAAVRGGDRRPTGAT